MTEATPVEFTEDGIPTDGIEETISELVELYGGEITAEAPRDRRFVLPLRRGVPTAGGIECMLAWTPGDGQDATVRLVCNRDIDAPKTQRVALLAVGAVGSVLFMLWPFFPQHREFGALAWMGGAVAIAVYLLSLKKTSGGLAIDFLQRLARRQRSDQET